MKKFFNIFFLVSFYLIGQDIQEKNILEAASKFFTKQLKDTFSVDLQIQPSFSSEFPDLLFIENKASKGFIVTTKETSFIPVIAYSFESSLSELHPGVKWYFKWIEDQIKWSKEQKVLPTKFTKNEWTLFLKNGILPTYSKYSISPLLSTKWNQDCYYNELCPEHPDGPCGHCYAGCVATAMGQVMKFHACPKKGEGSHMYGCNLYSNISANFEQTYLWDSMPAQLTSSNIPTATLLFHCGVSVDMDYTPTGSGSNLNLATEALKTYFKYEEYATYLEKNNISDQNWIDIIETELLAKRPLIYAGCGNDGCHAFVLDGKDASNRFHFNWGWGGAYDGFYYISNLNPGGVNFSSNQTMITGVEPKETDSIYCPNVQVYTNITDTIEDGSGPERYGNNTHCSWLIEPPGAGLIYIYFIHLATEKDADIIEIRQGTNENAPLVATISGYDLPQQPILVWGSAAYIHFSSDDILRSDGFKLYYSASMVNLSEYAQEKIKIFPNPAPHTFSIEIPDELFSENINIEIKNITQQNLFSIHPSENKISVTLDEPGMYFIQIKGSTFTTTKPLVIY
jgi:hypothetical protein